jgi:1-acyl-sn-glycerol-3-phosphate acyltransferase
MDFSVTGAACPALPPDAEPARASPRPFRDLYFIRIISTGLSFLLFGVVGTFLGIVVVPLLLAVPGTKPTRQARVRRMIRIAFRALVGFMNQAGAISYAFHGAESLGQRGQLVIANHPSLIDIVLLIAFVPGAACVVKRAAWRNPSMVLAVGAAGYVPNAPTEIMIDRAAELLLSGECLIMFPEGAHRDTRLHSRRASAPFEVRAVVQGPSYASALLAAHRRRHRSHALSGAPGPDCIARIE